MNNLNPNSKYIKTDGIDLPVMTVYLAGRISGDCIEKCLKWRKDIINYYKNYNGKGQYPISFLCPLNSGESESVDEKGLKSNIPPNLIYQKDLLSVEHADVIVANMDDFFEDDLYKYKWQSLDTVVTLGEKHIQLTKKIENRRENLGTTMEVAWALYLQKPIILIVPERRKEIFENHPFTKRASVIVTSVEQLLQEKWLQILYKSIASAVY